MREKYQAFYDHYWGGEDSGELCPECGAMGDEPHGDCEYPLWIRNTYGIG